MRMFCGFIWVGLDVYALLSGLWVYKSFLFSCGVLRALTCPPWCIRTPPGCPPPHAGEAKLRPTCPANAVIILLESTCPSYGQVRKSIMTPLPSENETYLVSPARGGAVERQRDREGTKSGRGARPHRLQTPKEKAPARMRALFRGRLLLGLKGVKTLRAAFSGWSGCSCRRGARRPSGPCSF